MTDSHPHPPNSPFPPCFCPGFLHSSISTSRPNCVRFPPSAALSHTLGPSHTRRCASPACPRPTSFWALEPSIAHTARHCLAHFHIDCFWTYVARFPSFGVDARTGQQEPRRKGRAQRCCPRCSMRLDMFAAEESALSNWRLAAVKGPITQVGGGPRRDSKGKSAVQTTSVPNVGNDDDEFCAAAGDEFERSSALRDPLAAAAGWDEKERVVKKQKYIEGELRLVRTELGDMHTANSKREELQEVLFNLTRMQVKLERQKRKLA